MRISPTIHLLILLLFVFFPAIHSWVIGGGAHWYRPYLIWLAVIVFAAWSIRRQQADDAK